MEVVFANEMSGMASQGQVQRRPAKVSRVEWSEKASEGRREGNWSQSSIRKDPKLETSLGYIVPQGEESMGK